MSASGGTLIKIKDDIHAKWFELQQTKRSDEENAFLQKNLYDAIVELGHQAVAHLEALDPQSKHLEPLKQVLYQTEWKSWVADETQIGYKPWYVMTPERGQEAITQDINKLANQIHRAGMSLIKVQGQYCGCDLAKDLEDLRSINTGVLRYCEGTLKLGHKRGVVHDPGDTVEHRPGAADRHANTVKFEQTEKGYDVTMEYVESGDANWQMRQDGVVDFIQKKRGSCEVHRGTITAKCEIKDASEEDIFEVALLISQLKDIDLLPEACIDPAFQGVQEQIVTLKAIEPRTDVWNSPWTRAGKMDAVLDCQGQEDQGREGPAESDEEENYEQKRRAERRHRQIERLEADALHQEEYVKEKIGDAAEQPCVFKAFSLLDDAYLGLEELEGFCDRLSDIQHGSWSWCMGLRKEGDRLVEEAAKDLVQRCPPEPIILGLEAAGRYGRISEMDRVCKLAGDEQCEKVIMQAHNRWMQGIQPGVLPLDVKRAWELGEVGLKRG